MRAAFVPEPNRVEVGDFPVPVASADGELVVRMIRASVCGSDVHVVFHGFHHEEKLGAPGYPGHEGIGEVVESRSSRIPVGTMVLTVPPGYLGGCFAEYQLLTDAYVVPVPADGDLPRLLLAQQYGTTLHAMRAFLPGVAAGAARGTVAIYGAGSAGLFFLQQAARLGYERILISDLNRERLEIAERLGATRVVHAPHEALVDAVLADTGGVGANLVIEAVGLDALRAEAIGAVAVGGTAGFFGFPERYGLVGFPMFEAFRKVVRIQWSGLAQFEPDLVAFHDAVQHIADGSIDVDHCLGTAYSLEDVPAALAASRDRSSGAVKIAIDIAGAGA